MFEPDHFNALCRQGLAARLGILVTACASAPVPALTVRMPVDAGLHAPHGFLHGGGIAVLADTACGFGALGHLPDGVTHFFTVESACNHLGAVREGLLECTARARHLGRSTQVWDAEVTHLDTGKLVAMFRCTQMLMRADGAEVPGTAAAGAAA